MAYIYYEYYEAENTMNKTLFKAFLFLLITCFFLSATAQDHAIDSLNKALQFEKQDTNKVNTLNALAVYFKVQYDHAKEMSYAQQALSLSRLLNYKHGEGTALFNIGDCYELQSMPDKAVQSFLASLEIRKAEGNKKLLGQAYRDLSNAYYDEGSIPQALQTIYAALKFYEEINDKDGMSQSYQSLSNINVEEGNDSEALKNLKTSLTMRESMGDMARVAQTLISISDLYSRDGNFNLSDQMTLQALNIYQTAGPSVPKWGIPYCYATRGNNYERQGKKELDGNKKDSAAIHFYDAINSYNQSFKYWSQLDNKIAIGQYYRNMSEVYFYLTKFKEAKANIEKSIETLKEAKNKEGVLDAYELSAQVDNAQQDFKSAFEDYKMYILYRDSIANEESEKKILQTQFQYQFDKKETAAQVAQEKKDIETKRIHNQQLIALVALGVVVIAVLIIVLIQFRNNKQKQKANSVISEQKQQVENALNELKSTQSQLIQSEKMASLGELTAGIAHEIQNPLNFVNNFSDVSKELLDEMKAALEAGDNVDAKSIAEDVIQNLEKINHHGKRADAIVKGMLQHSRASSGQKEPTDINALCDEYLRLSYHGLRAKDKNFNADFKTDFSDKIDKINIIPQDIGRVLLNLFNNAFYAVNEKKKTADQNYKPLVTVITKNAGSMLGAGRNEAIEVIIKDNGSGIPQHIIDKIYQPFFTTKPTGEGTGLGLSISYDVVVKAHNGSLNVESKQDEETVFTIVLPI